MFYFVFYFTRPKCYIVLNLENFTRHFFEISNLHSSIRGNREINEPRLDKKVLIFYEFELCVLSNHS